MGGVILVLGAGGAASQSEGAAKYGQSEFHGRPPGYAVVTIGVGDRGGLDFNQRGGVRRLLFKE
jgi:hypothetical protein